MAVTLQCVPFTLLAAALRPCCCSLAGAAATSLTSQLLQPTQEFMVEACCTCDPAHHGCLCIACMHCCCCRGSPEGKTAGRCRRVRAS